LRIFRAFFLTAWRASRAIDATFDAKKTQPQRWVFLFSWLPENTGPEGRCSGKNDLSEVNAAIAEIRVSGIPIPG
jgi:hypothetical protein